MNFKHVATILILAAIAVLLVGPPRCIGPDKDIYKQDSTSVIYDSATVKIKYYPVPITDTFQAPAEPIDTEAVVQAYFKRKEYVFRADTNDVKVSATGAIWKNELDTFQIKIQNLRPTEVEYYSAQPRHEIGAGIVLAPQIAAPILQYRYKRFQAGLGYNLAGRQGPVLSASYTLFKF